MSKKKVLTVFNFAGDGIVPDYATPYGGPWVSKITKTAGSPTVAIASGVCSLALDATSEVQNLCLYQLDQLGFDIDDLLRVAFWAKLTTALGANAKCRFGLASARADDVDAIAASIFFGCTGAATVNCESDDGTNETAATSSGDTLSTTFKKFVIDFSKGVYSAAPPPSNVGGKYAVEFYMENASGFLRRVCSGTRFNMGSHATGLQLFAQIQKTATTNLGTLALSRVEVEHYVAG